MLTIAPNLVALLDAPRPYDHGIPLRLAVLAFRPPGLLLCELRRGLIGLGGEGVWGRPWRRRGGTKRPQVKMDGSYFETRHDQ